MRVKIGTVTISDTKEFTQLYEYAAYSMRISVQPCTVDLFGEVFPDGKVNDSSVHYTVTGKVVYSNPPANTPIKSVTVQPYAHALAKGILVDGFTHIVLEGFKAIPVDFVYDGKNGRTYNIVKD